MASAHSTIYSPEWAPDRDTVYRVLDEAGQRVGPLPESFSPQLGLRLYQAMRAQRLIDERMLTLQRQGRISFYGACTGQEAAVYGTGAALEPTDWVFPALREGGILLWRGHNFSHYVAQLYGSAADPTLGRQMPCHYSSKALRFVSLSSPIGTQLPQAVGAAMALHITAEPAVVAAYMGDGATSEGDFHTALRWAGLRALPLVFVCQNNQWAISVPTHKQTRARTLAAKAPAYGMPGVRVDGNDAIACFDAMRRAVQRARAGHGPTFIEALTYRVGAHSTSDDPSRYRDESVTEQWKTRDPLARLRTWLSSAELPGGPLWSPEQEDAFVTERDAFIKATVKAQEEVGPPPADSLFEDVYATLPPHLVAQRAELRRALPAGTP